RGRCCQHRKAAVLHLSKPPIDASPAPWPPLRCDDYPDATNDTPSMCAQTDLAVDQLETLDWPTELPDQIGDRYPRLAGHQRAWISGIAQGLRHPAYLLRTSREREITGILPLMQVKSPLFGRFLVSLPYIN